MIPALWTSPPLTAEESARWTTSEERAAAAGFVSERRRAEFLTWRAVVRRELGDDVGIAYDALGAPVLTNRAVHISVAHCAGRIAVCASPGALRRGHRTRNARFQTRREPLPDA